MCLLFFVGGTLAALLRLLLGWMYAQPGKKLLFMGGELAQWDEWNHERSLDWHLLEWGPHWGVQRLMRDLNSLYRGEPALHVRDAELFHYAWETGLGNPSAASVADTPAAAHLQYGFPH